MREQTPPISAVGAKRRSTRIVHTVPLVVTWVETKSRTVVEQTSTLSINCHGCRYLSRQRPKKNASITLQITDNTEGAQLDKAGYAARIAWVRKSRRLDGLYQVGVELVDPVNIWAIDEVPDDWGAFSPSAKEDPASFLAEVDRVLHFAREGTYYQLLGVESRTPQPEVKRRFYHLARRFHPDRHMGHPEWTPSLLVLMDALMTAYKTLSDERAKKDYDLLLVDGLRKKAGDFKNPASGYLDKARECMAEKNYAGSILWLHRAIEIEPNSSSYRAMLGRCLSAIPEYRREAVEQFEKAIEMDSHNLAAHLHYGEMLEHMKLPDRARSHYLRVLELDAHHQGARENLNRLHAGTPRASSRPSLLGRLTGRR